MFLSNFNTFHSVYSISNLFCKYFETNFNYAKPENAWALNEPRCERMNTLHRNSFININVQHYQASRQNVNIEILIIPANYNHPWSCIGRYNLNFLN